MASRIVDLIPAHTHYGEVFAGAGWVFFNKPESRHESLNDLNSDLVAFYRVLQNHLEEFCRQFRWLISSRELFNDWNRQLAAGGLTDIQKAAKFYYLQRQAFGGKLTGRTFGTCSAKAPRINLLRLEEELSEVHLRLARVVIEHLPWQEYVSRYDSPSTFFYADPPYWGFEDFYGKGMFARQDFAALAAHLAAIKGKFILSINDVPAIRSTFAAFNMRTVKTIYCNKKVAPEVQELLISNF